MKYFSVGMFGFLFAGVMNANAASLYIDPPQHELNLGDAVELAVRLDVDEKARECINAIDAVIHYSGAVTPVDVSIGNSIMRVWVEEPVINTQNRTITFAGGIPNGYCGRVQGDPRLTNELIRIIARSTGENTDGEVSSAEFSFSNNSAVYKNDGLGTLSELSTFGTALTLYPEAGESLVDPWRDAVDADVIPPEEFSITLQRDTKAFAGDYYIVFSTTDKQTGIDQYQVLEQPLSDTTFSWGQATAPWITARSPYVLDDQNLNSSIFVKALDKAGNEYIAKLVPDPELRTKTPVSILTLLLFFGGFILIAILGLIIWNLLPLRKVRPEEEGGYDSGVESEYKQDDSQEAQTEDSSDEDIMM